MNCKAVQHSDQMVCEACDLKWDVNDPYPPVCAPKPPHRLYEKGDPGAPDVIKDANGDITLGLCKQCGRAEIELDEPCASRGVVDEADLLGAIARGWCAPENASKELDADLATAIMREVQALQAAALPADHTTEARTLEAVRAKLSPSEWAILCVAFQDHHAAAASKVHAALPAVPGVLSAVERQSVEELIASADHDAGDVFDLPPDQDSDEDAYWAYHRYQALTKLLAATPAHDQPEGDR